MAKKLTLQKINKVLTKAHDRWRERHGDDDPPADAQDDEGADVADVPRPESSSYAHFSDEQKRREIARIEAGLKTLWNEPAHESAPRRNGRPLVNLRMTALELDAEADRFAADGESARVFVEAYSFLFEFIFADGPHPGHAMRRLYMLAKKYRPDCIWDMGYRALGLLLGESHAAMEWRISILDEYALNKGITGVKMGWQKTCASSAAFSKAQRGNSNRLGGKKSGKHKMNGAKKHD
jgi:hypothetical protein